MESEECGVKREAAYRCKSRKKRSSAIHQILHAFTLQNDCPSWFLINPSLCKQQEVSGVCLGLLMQCTVGVQHQLRKLNCLLPRVALAHVLHPYLLIYLLFIDSSLPGPSPVFFFFFIMGAQSFTGLIHAFMVPAGDTIAFLLSISVGLVTGMHFFPLRARESSEGEISQMLLWECRCKQGRP